MRSYIRFRVDLAEQPAITLSHDPPTTVNNVRIQLECRCAVTDGRTGQTEVFGLGAACKTERVGAEQDLWLQPNADFNLVASEENFLIIKQWQKKDMGVMRQPASLGPQPQRQVGRVDEAWTAFELVFREQPARQLDSIEQIIAAIRGDNPIVARTAYDEGDYRVVIDQPVKTINYSERENVFQTDTGPIVLPDLRPQRLDAESQLVGCLDLAYSAFNAADWIEFIVNVPVELSADIRVDHYAQPRRIEPVENTLFELVG